MKSIELDVLRACAGEIVQLPYNKEQEEATKRLKQAGLIYTTMEDDCPTNRITFQGEMFLQSFVKPK